MVFNLAPSVVRTAAVTNGPRPCPMLRCSTSRLIETDLASGAQKVLVDWPALNYDPVHSPDGTELAFASNITGEYQIYRVRLSDGKPYRVTSGPGEAREPDYRPLRSAAESGTSQKAPPP